MVKNCHASELKLNESVLADPLAMVRKHPDKYVLNFLLKLQQIDTGVHQSFALNQSSGARTEFETVKGSVEKRFIKLYRLNLLIGRSSYLLKQLQIRKYLICLTDELGEC